jgi:hypothetical protein
VSGCLSLKRCAHGNPPLAEMRADRSPPSDSLLDDFWTPINHYDGRQVAHAVGRFWRGRTAMRDRLVQPQRQGTGSLRLINGATYPPLRKAHGGQGPRVDAGSRRREHRAVEHWPQLEALEAASRAFRESIERYAIACHADVDFMTPAEQYAGESVRAGTCWRLL